MGAGPLSRTFPSAKVMFVEGVLDWTRPRMAMQSLLVRGRARNVELQSHPALSRAELDPALEDLSARGYLVRRDDHIELTIAGRDDQLDWLAQRREEAVTRAGLEQVLAVVASHNRTVKSTITAWQVRVIGDSIIINDHSDRSYDSGVLGAFRQLAADVDHDLRVAVADDAWYVGYVRRLKDAADLFLSGDSRELAMPLTGSYHDVWMELHADILLALDLRRDSEDDV